MCSRFFLDEPMSTRNNVDTPALWFNRIEIVASPNLQFLLGKLEVVHGAGDRGIKVKMLT